MVVEAVQRAQDRLRTRLDRHGPVPEAGSGFRGYARTVLRNEVRRQLARESRRRARRLEPEESVPVEILADGSRPPLPAIARLDGVRLICRAWPHRRREQIARSYEERMRSGSLVIEAMGKIRLAVSDRPDRSLFPPVDLQVRGSHFQIRNVGAVSLHVQVLLAAWHDDEGWHKLPRRMPLFDTTRGIGTGPGLGGPTPVAKTRDLGPRRVPPPEPSTLAPSTHPCRLDRGRSDRGDRGDLEERWVDTGETAPGRPAAPALASAGRWSPRSHGRSGRRQ